jgi:hypothetical protein
MRGYYAPQPERVAAALAVHLTLYGAVFSLFLVFLYSLLQPTVVRNPGLAAYEAPPGTVISLALPARLLAAGEPIEPVASVQPAPEALSTDGRAPKQAEASPAELKPAEVKPPKRRPAKSPPKERQSPAINYAAFPRYLGDQPF